MAYQNLYLVGSFNSWTPGDANYLMTNNQDGTYYFDNISFSAGTEIKIVGTSWSVNYGFSSSPTTISLDTTYNAYSGGGNGRFASNITIARIVLDTNNLTIKFLSSVVTYPDLYLFGETTNWEMLDSYKFVNNQDGTYTLNNVTLNGQFAFIDTDYFAYRTTESTDTNIEPDTTYSLEKSYEEVYAKLETETTFSKIQVDLNNLTFTCITKVYSEWYLRGEVNAWGATEEYRLIDEGNNIYSLSDVTITGEFKIGKSDWSVSYGGSYSGVAFQLNTPVSVNTYPGYNLLMDSATFCSRVELNLNNNTLTITEGEAIEIPSELYLYNGTEYIKLTNVMDGVFTWSSKYTSGTYKIVASNTDTTSLYTITSTTESIDSPFYRKCSLVNDTTGTDFEISTESKYRFYIDLINNTLEVTDVSNSNYSDFYLNNNEYFSQKYRFKHETTDFYVLENVFLYVGQLMIDNYTTGESYGSQNYGVSLSIDDKTSVLSSKWDSLYSLRVNEKVFCKKIELFTGASAYIYVESGEYEYSTIGGNNSFVKKLYLGSTEIIRAYLGNILLLGEAPVINNHSNAFLMTFDNDLTPQLDPNLVFDNEISGFTIDTSDVKFGSGSAQASYDWNKNIYSHISGNASTISLLDAWIKPKYIEDGDNGCSNETQCVLKARHFENDDFFDPKYNVCAKLQYDYDLEQFSAEFVWENASSYNSTQPLSINNNDWNHIGLLHIDGFVYGIINGQIYSLVSGQKYTGSFNCICIGEDDQSPSCGYDNLRLCYSNPLKNFSLENGTYDVPTISDY